MFDRLVKNLVEREGSRSVVEMPLREISVNPYQTRRNFNQEKLEGLARSIKEIGVVQPIIVRKVKAGYELVTGERRLRACKLAGFETIPAIVRALDDKAVIEITFIENMQREQLDEMEKAEAYGRLLENPEDLEIVAGRVGKDAKSIERRLWALKLPKIVKKAVSAKIISPDQARLIAEIGEESKQIELLESIFRLNAVSPPPGEGAAEHPAGAQESRFDKLMTFVSLVRDLIAVLRTAGIKARVSENFDGDSLDIKLSFNIDSKTKIDPGVEAGK